MEHTWADHLHSLRSMREVRRNLQPVTTGVSPRTENHFHVLHAVVVEVALICDSYLSAGIGVQVADAPTGIRVDVGPDARGSRAAWVVAAISATALTAGLEGFLRCIGEEHVDSGVLRRLRKTDWGRSLNLPADDKAAATGVVGALKPSQKKDGKRWLAALSEVFGLTIPDAVAESLKSMVVLRNVFVHEPRPATEEGYQPPGPDELQCWFHALELFTHDVAEAVSARSTAGAP